MVRIDENGRDGGGRREDIPLNFSPSFHFFLFLSFSNYYEKSNHYGLWTKSRKSEPLDHNEYNQKYFEIKVPL